MASIPGESVRQKLNRQKIQQMSKKQLIETLKKKKECDAKAQSIVEHCLEKSIDRDEFLSQLTDINQCHYDDIVDERFILKICGYPLCGEILTNVPTKQYQISTVQNKVYDITERKKFCSNQCYKASLFIKEQMLTSPLWLRDQEIIPEFKLLSINDNQRDEKKN